jgi:hypothetical protein
VRFYVYPRKSRTGKTRIRQGRAHRPLININKSVSLHLVSYSELVSHIYERRSFPSFKRGDSACRIAADPSKGRASAINSGL